VAVTVSSQEDYLAIRSGELIIRETQSSQHPQRPKPQNLNVELSDLDLAEEGEPGDQNPGTRRDVCLVVTTAIAKMVSRPLVTSKGATSS